MPPFVHYKTGINRFLVHAMGADIGKSLLHIHILFQSDVLGCHNTSSTVVRILQKLVNDLPGFRRCIAHHSLDNCRRKFLQHVHRIVHKEIFHNLMEFRICNAVYNMFLNVRLQTGKSIRRQFLGKHTKNQDFAVIIQFLHKFSNIRFIHISQMRPEGSETMFLYKLQQFFQIILFHCTSLRFLCIFRCRPVSGFFATNRYYSSTILSFFLAFVNKLCYYDI